MSAFLNCLSHSQHTQSLYTVRQVEESKKKKFGQGFIKFTFCESVVSPTAKGKNGDWSSMSCLLKAAYWLEGKYILEEPSSPRMHLCYLSL